MINEMKKRYLVGIAPLIVVFIFLVSGCAPSNSEIATSTDVPRLRSIHYFTGKFSLKTIPIVNESKFDVIVVGSDPEAISAAIAAARAGERTLLIDKNPIVGGLFTLGKLNMLDLSISPTNDMLTKGLFLEFYKNINKRTSFDVKETQRVFEEMLANGKNLAIQLNAREITPVMGEKNPQVKGLTFKDSTGKTKKIYAKKFIDGTPDADFAYLAGAKFSIGQEDYRNQQKMMAVTVVFELSGVDFIKVNKYLNSDDDKYTGADQYSAWGFGTEMARYKPTEDNVRIRALNIGKQNSGNVLINAFQILGVNGLNKNELEEARRKTEVELPRITKFLQENLIGFESAKLVGMADQFYIRETRHLEAEYQLTIDDAMENRDFDDRIAFGGYPIDVQATVLSEGDVIVGNPEQFAIPFRSIVPKGFDNLLVVSRSTGYDSLAHGSARTVPVGMVIGEAAGIAAGYTNQEDINFQTIIADKSLTHIKNIQRILNEKGADLKPIPNYENPVVDNWAYNGVKFLRGFALIAAGYDNNYRLDEPLTNEEFTELLNKVSTYSQAQFEITIPGSDEQKTKPITQKDIHDFLKANRLSVNNLTQTTKDHLQQQTGALSRDIIYMVIYEFFQTKEQQS